jgi:hypothetical protein
MNDYALISEDDEDYEKEGLKVKVKRLGIIDKSGSMGLIGNDRRMSS